MDCNKVEQLQVGNVSIWQISGQTAFFYEAGMAIDADGAPNAYHPEPDSNLGLDFLANAGSPGNWFGIVTDNGQRDGNPIIQGPDDPAPGFYVSPTSLQDRTKERTDPLRYVDATQIPYIALPPEVRSNLGAQLGDFAVVIRSKSSQLSKAIFADIGPRRKIGEGSVAFANALGISSSPRHGGTDSGMIYIVFPGSGNGNPRGIDEIRAEADGLFEAMGGMAQLQACFPELLPLPTVTSISPTSGPAEGGTSVTISGTGFTGATQVSFGSTAASSFTVDSDVQITAISPAANLSGPVDVTVTTSSGMSSTSIADQFTYITAGPTVTAIDPTSGPAEGGTSVIISGTGFNGATSVLFGSTAASSFTVDSDTQITAVSPAAISSGTIDVAVTTSSGTSVTSSADQFTYIT